MAAGAGQHEHLHAFRALVQDRLAVFQLGDHIEPVERQLLGGARYLVAGEAQFAGLEVLDEFADVLGRREFLAQGRHLFGLGLDVDLLQAVDMAIAEERGARVVVLLDVIGRWFDRYVAHPFDGGARQHVGLGGFELLHHPRVAVEFEGVGLAQQQLLIDQAFEDQLARGIGLFRPQATLLLQHKIDLVDGDFFFVDPGRRLACRCVFLCAAPAEQNEWGHKNHERKLPKLAA